MEVVFGLVVALGIVNGTVESGHPHITADHSPCAGERVAVLSDIEPGKVLYTTCRN